MASTRSTEPNRYHVYLDHLGFMIDVRSYRVNPAPLMGTKFSTGRTAYSSLDFWQIGAMTDFSKGINQQYQNDPSQYYDSEGIDVSIPGEFRLERDLVGVTLPGDVGYKTAQYKTLDTLYLGTSLGYVLKTVDGITFTIEKYTGVGKIYGFYEFDEVVTTVDGVAGTALQRDQLPGSGTPTLTTVSSLYVMKGQYNAWKLMTKNYRNEDLSEHSTSAWYELDGTGGRGAVKDIYFVMVESDYAYGLFNDGIRQSVDGEAWVPAPPDPLWSLPDAEGIALNAVTIPRGFLIGAKRGLYIFVGGGSGMNIWTFPEGANVNNFKGMAKVGPYGLFSIENEGLFFTDGSKVYPTFLTWLNRPRQVISCTSMLQCGWDVFATVKDKTGQWLLVRCNLTYSQTPQFWWPVKKLGKEPCLLSAFSKTKLFIHYIDGTADSYDKESGPYQTSGYLTTSLLDESLVLLQKQYKTLFAILSDFPTSTGLGLSYSLSEYGTMTSKTFTGDGISTEEHYVLPNPTTSNRILIKASLTSSDTSKTPIVTDLCWRYILERPQDEPSLKKLWSFMILAEDSLEKLDLGKEEEGLDDPRTAMDVVTDIWAIADKKQVLNFVGADNVSDKAFELEYTGLGSSCLVTIDQSNSTISATVTGAVEDNFSISFYELTIEALVDTINALASFRATIDNGTPQNQMASTLMPVKDVEAHGIMDVFWGTDVHTVIIMPPTPGQVKMAQDYNEIENTKITSDRISLTLRET